MTADDAALDAVARALGDYYADAEGQPNPDAHDQAVVAMMTLRALTPAQLAAAFPQIGEAIAEAIEAAAEMPSTSDTDAVLARAVCLADASIARTFGRTDG